MSKTITIPDVGINPVTVTIGVDTYSYRAGATVTVPDEVAAAIANMVALAPTAASPAGGAYVVIAKTGGKPGATLKQIASAAARGSAVFCVLDAKRVLHLKDITSSKVTFNGAGYTVEITSAGAQTVTEDEDYDDAVEAATEAAAAAAAAAGNAEAAAAALLQAGKEYTRRIPESVYDSRALTSKGLTTSSGTASAAIFVVPTLDARIKIDTGYKAKIYWYTGVPTETSSSAGANITAAYISSQEITESKYAQDIAPAGAGSFTVQFFTSSGGAVEKSSTSVGVYLQGGAIPDAEITWGKTLSGNNNSRAICTVDAGDFALYCQTTRTQLGFYSNSAATTEISHTTLGTHAGLVKMPESCVKVKIVFAGATDIYTKTVYNRAQVIAGFALYAPGTQTYQQVKISEGTTADAVDAAEDAMDDAVEAMQATVAAAVSTIDDKVDSRYLKYEDPVTLWWEAGGINQTSSSASGGPSGSTNKMHTYMSGKPGDGQTLHKRFLDSVDIVLDVDLTKCKVLDIFYYNDDVTPGDSESATDHSCYMQSMIYKKNGQGLDNPTYPASMSRIYVKDYAPAGATRIRICAALPDDADFTVADERALITGIKAHGRDGLVADEPRSEGVRNMQRRARLVETVPYVTVASLPAQDGNIAANSTVRGVMYSSTRLNLAYVPDYVSLETYMTQMQYAESAIYNRTQQTYTGGSPENGKTWLGCVCSSLVRFALDILPPYTTSHWLRIPGMHLAPSQSFEDVELGDTVCSNGSGHVVIITDIWRDKYGTIKQIETTEAVTPSCKRLVRTPAQLAEYFFGTEAAKHYMICRYDYIDKVTYREDPFWSVPGDREYKPYAYNKDLYSSLGEKSVINIADSIVGDDELTVYQRTAGWTTLHVAVNGVDSTSTAPGKDEEETISLTAAGMYDIWLTDASSNASDHVHLLVVDIDAPVIENSLLKFTSMSAYLSGDANVVQPFAVLLQDATKMGFTSICEIAERDAYAGSIQVANLPTEMTSGTGYLRVLYKTAYGVVASDKLTLS